MSNQARKDWPLGRVSAALTLLASMIFLAACVGYTRGGAPLLDRLSLSVGEVLMKEGLRLEDAGALENAKERYSAALASRFAGEQNRAYTQKLLGSLYWNEGDYETARKHLREAAESTHTSPSFFPPYCDTLLHLKDWDEATRAVARWQKLVAKGDDTASMAEAKYFEGRIALGQGDRDRAKAAFNEGLKLAPGSKSAAELAQLAFEDNDYPAALAHADAYLNTGAAGARADKIRELRRRITTLQHKN